MYERQKKILGAIILVIIALGFLGFQFFLTYSLYGGQGWREAVRWFQGVKTQLSS